MEKEKEYNALPKNYKWHFKTKNKFYQIIKWESKDPLPVTGDYLDYVHYAIKLDPKEKEWELGVLTPFGTKTYTTKTEKNAKDFLICYAHAENNYLDTNSKKQSVVIFENCIDKKKVYYM